MHTRVCVPRNVHTHTHGQLIATYVGAVITVGKEELTEPRYIVRVPEFRPCARTRTPKKGLKKKKKITKKKKEWNLGLSIESCTAAGASRNWQKGREFSKGDPARASDAPRCHRYLLINFPIRSFIRPRINAYNFRDDYRASTPSMNPFNCERGSLPRNWNGMSALPFP